MTYCVPGTVLGPLSTSCDTRLAYHRVLDAHSAGAGPLYTNTEVLKKYFLNPQEDRREPEDWVRMNITNTRMLLKSLSVH